MLPLYGRFKGEGGVARCFVPRMSCKTKNGFDLVRWVDRVIAHEHASENMYLFTDNQGRKESPSYVYEAYMHSLLKQI